MNVLFKLSAPGWEKEFTSKEELRKELYTHMCGICRQGDKAYDPETNEVIWESSPVNENSSIDELLFTACGCEFDVELENE
jgi:hypothetical protein